MPSAEVQVQVWVQCGAVRLHLHLHRRTPAPSQKLHTLQISQQLWAPQISNKPSPAHLGLSLPFPPPLSFIL